MNRRSLFRGILAAPLAPVAAKLAAAQPGTLAGSLARFAGIDATLAGSVLADSTWMAGNVAGQVPAAWIAPQGGWVDLGTRTLAPLAAFDGERERPFGIDDGADAEPELPWLPWGEPVDWAAA